MPIDTIPAENKPVAERLRAGMLHFGYDVRGGKIEFAKRYLGDAKKAPMVTDWRKGRYLPGNEIMRAIAKDWSCTFDWLRFGDGAAPAWYGTVAAPAQIFTRERRAEGDVLAIQIAVESMLAALLPRVQGAAAGFLADVEPIAKKHRFSTTAGLLGSLVDIAREVHSAEATEARARRRGGSAARTKP